MKDNHYILLTIDVEDWFQVENFKRYIPFSSWPSCELRVQQNTHRLLDLFDAFEQKKYPKNLVNPVQPSTNKIKATFFILGWLGKRLPNLIREIHDRGHEIASHGFNHTLCTQFSSNDLKADLIHSKKTLEDIIGHKVNGYRAPSFSINNYILKTIEDSGYLYDSSYNSFALHDRYGQMDFSRNKRKGIEIQISETQHLSSLRGIFPPQQGGRLRVPSIQKKLTDTFYELPISNLKFGNIIFPLGGGGYFRFFPFVLFKTGIRKILKKENAFLFYFHPWEIDSEQPRVKDAKMVYKFRHYLNLKKTKTKLIKLFKEFEHCQFITCSQYLQGLNN